VQQRLRLRGGVEIAAVAPQHEVRDERRAAGDVLAEVRVLQGKEEPPPDRPRGQQHDDQRGEDALDAARVEIGEAEGAALEAAEHDRGDQKARDHEEDVDADEAAGHAVGKRVEADDREHGDGTEAVDVGPVFRLDVRVRHVQRSAAPGAGAALG